MLFVAKFGVEIKLKWDEGKTTLTDIIYLLFALVLIVTIYILQGCI